ncbi:hypothetical protein JMM81_21930 [Bacillus sp. V3B]|uniref:hypothetical protein n=1 Tax=Bacillus sp. V3B TaxID=2804915 RepID=UPI00210CCC7F|nr:hypothetical protein [Bacillus sp. V3B]MCQ6277522.1 hypothetical protein [Bacillus sp. V3B]
MGKVEHWQQELNDREGLVCFDLSLKLSPNNEIYLNEKEMYEYCGYKSPKYFKKHLESLIEKCIIFRIKKEDKIHYFFNPIYVEYDELGPKMYHRPFINKEIMKEAMKNIESII